MNNSRILLCVLSVVAFFIASCSQKLETSSENGEIVDIPLITKVPTTSDFSSVYKLENFIQLETNVQALIADLSKVVVTPDSLLVILDKKQEAILVFNFSGKYLTSVKRLGGGPEEYREIKDITYNQDEKSIVVLDTRSQALLSYSIYTGDFLKRIKFEQRDTYGYTIDYFDGNYIFNRSNFAPQAFPGQVVVADATDLTIKRHGIPQNKTISNSPVDVPNCLNITDSSAFTLDFLNDTIYEINENSITPTFCFKYPKKKANRTAQELMDGNNKYGDDYMAHLFSDGGIWNFKNLFIIDNFIYFSFSSDKKAVVNIFDRTNSKNYAAPAFVELNKEYYVNPPIASFKDLLISTVIPTKREDKYLDQNPLLCSYKININRDNPSIAVQ